MGTVVTIDVYTTDGTAGAALSRQLATARAILQRADAVFSTWQPHSPVSRLRRGEITSAQAPAEVCEVLGQCAIARELSGGWFDPWAMPGGLDPTGYVKGWAAQKALGAFRAQRQLRRDRERGRGHRQLRRPGTWPALQDRHRRPLLSQASRRGCLPHRRHRHLGYLRARRTT